jgi:hypothetical protein
VLEALGKTDAQTSVAGSFAVLVFASVLLLLIGFVGRRNRSSKEA